MQPPYPEIPVETLHEFVGIIDYYDRAPNPECLTNFHLAVNANIFRVSFLDVEDFDLIESLYHNKDIRDC